MENMCIIYKLGYVYQNIYRKVGSLYSTLGGLKLKALRSIAADMVL